MNQFNREELKKKYGITEYEGKKYIAIEDAYVSSYVDEYNEACEGEEYEFSMQAKAINIEHEENEEREEKQYFLYWVFDATKGEEKDLSEYDYSQATDVKELQGYEY
jgi:hypothetical protein